MTITDVMLSLVFLMFIWIILGLVRQGLRRRNVTRLDIKVIFVFILNIGNAIIWTMTPVGWVAMITSILSGIILYRFVMEDMNERLYTR